MKNSTTMAAIFDLKAIIFLLLLYIIAMIIFLYWYKASRLENFEKNQRQLIQVTAEHTKTSLEFFIQNIQRHLDIFVEEKAALIYQLYQTPDRDFPIYDTILRQLKRYFPKVNSYTLSTHDGEPIIEEFDGFIGKVCRMDIKNFSSTNKNTIKRLHPNPKFRHVDFMSRWKHQKASGIFMATFDTSVIYNFLRNFEHPGIRLKLLHKTRPGLIEFTARGERFSYERNWNLSDAEKSVINTSLPIANTQWMLYIHTDLQYKKQILQQINQIQLKIFLGLGALGIVCFIYLLFAYRRVQQANVLYLRSQQQLQHDALHDVLTGLPNRLQLSSRLKLGLAQMQRNNNQIAVMFIDLDGFKAVNDQFGHDCGDKVLKQIAQRLRQNFRDSDTICRLGGDEFIVIIDKVSSIEDVAHLAQQTLEKISLEITDCGHNIQISGSIGIAIAPDNSCDIDTLLALSDKAMYQAKKAGKNRYVFYHAANTQ